MPSVTGSEKSPGVTLPQVTFCFRCIGCGSVASEASHDFRCSQCGNLLEISDPGWKASGLNASALKSVWRERRSSNAALAAVEMISLLRAIRHPRPARRSAAS